MRNGLLLLLIAVAGTVNGLFLDRIQEWRWALFVVIPLLSYLQGRHFPVRREWAPLAAVTAPTAVYLLVDFPIGIGGLLSLAIFVTLPWLAGKFRRQQADLVRIGQERVEHLEREQQFVAERARLLERARIAADMHDALGHELALLSLRAGALELAPDLTEQDRAAATELRRSAVSASDRLRHAVTGMRAALPDRSFSDGGRGASVSDSERGASVSESERGASVSESEEGGSGTVAGDVEQLVGRARDAGMVIRMDPVGDLGSAADGMYRLVREALTNAARHAPGAEVDIRLERADDTVTVTVRNDKAVTRRDEAVGPGPRSGSGTGLASLREHLAVRGGTLHVTDGEGVFTVTARLRAR